MKNDIDFDELDKAVNSLMGNVKPDASDETVKPKTLSISSTLKPDEKPSYQKLDEVARTIGNEALVTDAEQSVVIEDLDASTADVAKASDSAGQAAMLSIAPDLVPTLPVDVPAAVSVQTTPGAALQQPAVKGRFMDVVHPSSDMRGTNSLPPLQIPDRGAPADDKGVDAPVSVAAAAVSESPAEAPTKEVVDPEPIVEESTASEPALTPFLPDAKVEKRPLGAPLAPSGAIPSPFDDSKDETPVNVAESAPGAIIPSVETAEETITVNSETKPVVNDSQVALDASELPGETPEEAAAIAAVESNDAGEVTAEADSASIQAVESGDTEKLTAMRQAIKADLKPKSDEPTETAGTIYDVDNQPQPLSHPAQQKSGIGTLVIIVVIIVVAAVLGAVAYFALGLGS